jgi:hypothetical protein
MPTLREFTDEQISFIQEEYAVRQRGYDFSLWSVADWNNLRDGGCDETRAILSANRLLLIAVQKHNEQVRIELIRLNAHNVKSVEIDAIVDLLIEKSVFTRLEYRNKKIAIRTAQVELPDPRIPVD